MKHALSIASLVFVFGAGCAASPAAPAPIPRTNQPSTSANTATAPTKDTSTSTANVPNKLTLAAAQKGNSVSVESASLTTGGYIVIRLDDKGKPGLAIATSAYLPAGESKGLNVNIPLTSGKTYWAELHKDNGDSKWNEAQDELIPSTSSSPTIVSFRVAP